MARKKRIYPRREPRLTHEKICAIIERRYQKKDGSLPSELDCKVEAWSFEHYCKKEEYRQGMGWNFRDRPRPMRPTESRLHDWIHWYTDLVPRTTDTIPVRLQTS
jgi:hypothetical protein